MRQIGKLNPAENGYFVRSNRVPLSQKLSILIQNTKNMMKISEIFCKSTLRNTEFCYNLIAGKIL